MAHSLLSIIVWFPIICGVGLYLFGLACSGYTWSGVFLKGAAVVSSLATALLALAILGEIDFQTGEPQLTEIYSWVPSMGVSYALGVHGISALYAVSITFLMVLIIAWSRLPEGAGLAALLCAEGAMLGVLFSRDLVLFYLFWELMLIPVFLLMVFQGGERRLYAAYRFLLFTACCAVFVISGLLYLSIVSVRQLGSYSFLIHDLMNLKLNMVDQVLLGGGFLIAFLVKVPVFPLHSWLRDAQCESPFEGALLFTAILFQMGIYGLVTLVFPLFPLGWETLSPLIATLAVVSVLYGAMLAFKERNLRALVAYSSISHLGLCTLGIACFGVVTITGAIFHSIAHALSAAAILFILGFLERNHGIVSRDQGGGLAYRAPVVATVFFVLLTGYLALPLTNGFVGEVVVLVGSFSVFPILTTVSFLGIVFGTVYAIQMYGDIFFGASHLKLGTEGERSLQFTWREWCALSPLLVLTFALGFFPTPVFRVVEGTSKQLVNALESRRSADHGRLLQRQVEQDDADGIHPSPVAYFRN
jgi:NADH-quinone oxidoreductase subunit M